MDEAHRLPVHEIVKTIRSFFPEVQAIYLFGSFVHSFERQDSDVDLAILLPVVRAKVLGSLAFSDCSSAIEDLVNRSVDLVNLRETNTVFQNEIIHTGERIGTFDNYETEVFEMLSLSFYQKLNEERREILEEIAKSGRVFSL